MMKTVPEEEFVDKLQVRPSSLQGWLILFWVKFSALHSTSLKCYSSRTSSIGIFPKLTEGLFVGGRALKRLMENM